MQPNWLTKVYCQNLLSQYKENPILTKELNQSQPTTLYFKVCNNHTNNITFFLTEGTKY